MGSQNPSSSVRKRSIVLAGHKTSVSLEDQFWEVLRKFAASRQQTLSEYIVAIDVAREQPNLSSAIRVHLLEQLISETRLLRHAANIGGARPNQAASMRLD